MIPIKQTIKRRGTGFSAKEWRGILGEAWEWAGMYWHKFILPKHFTRAGANEYDYMPRTKKYMIKKGRRYHHQRPLVFTGTLERAAKRIRDIRGNSKGANVVLKNLPAWIYRSVGSQAGPISWAGPSISRELSAISEKDAGVIAKVLNRKIQRAIDTGAKVIDITRGHSTGTI